MLGSSGRDSSGDLEVVGLLLLLLLSLVVTLIGIIVMFVFGSVAVTLVGVIAVGIAVTTPLGADDKLFFSSSFRTDALRFSKCSFSI